MENNKENKSKFFAQYWGQKVLSNRNKGTKKHLVSTYEIHPFTGIGESDYLELTPLHLISDEDAIEVVKLIDKKSKSFLNVNYSFAEKKQLPYIKSVISDIGRIDILSDYSCVIDGKTTNFNLEIFDNLRLKGFSVPFNGLSVEEQVSRNWVVLRTKI